MLLISFNAGFDIGVGALFQRGEALAAVIEALGQYAE